MSWTPDRGTMKKLKFTVPVPSSSKNNRQLCRTQKGGITSLPSRSARRSKAEIQSAAREAVATLLYNHGTDGYESTAFGPNDDIAVDITHDVKADTVTVEVWSTGPKPKGKTGRGRDIDNFASTILDALNGLAYGDDRQVSWLQVKRSVS